MAWGFVGHGREFSFKSSVKSLKVFKLKSDII